MRNDDARDGEEEFEDAAEEDDRAPAGDVYKWGWNGEWPTATGKLAKHFTDHGDVAKDKQTAEDVYTFLRRPTANLADLNEFEDASFFIINVPNTNKVRVVYGIRSTTDTPLDPDSTRKLWFLTQDLPDEDARAPGVMELPTSVRDQIVLQVPSDTSFDALDAWPTTWNAFTGSSLADAVEVTIMKLAPVPFFVIRDGLEGDLQTHQHRRHRDCGPKQPPNGLDRISSVFLCRI